MTQSNSKGAQVRVVNTKSMPTPQSAITIAVDTEYVISRGGGNVTNGIYMFDNRLTNGSKGEGSLELSSRINLGAISASMWCQSMTT
jgi:hypothetical protein